MNTSKELFLQKQLEKFAQRRSLRSRLRRKVNLTGKALEQLNKTYKEVVQKMDKLDEQIRKDAENLGLLLKEARNLAKKRDYFGAAADLSRFHEKTNLISARLRTFSVGLKDDHYRFLLKYLSGEHKAKLLSYDPKQEIKFADDGFIAEAGLIGDIWHNIFGDRPTKARYALETKFSKSFMRELREDTFEVIDQAEQMFEFLKEKFNELGSAWSKRDVGLYSSLAEEYVVRFNDFHKDFLKYYEKYIPRLQETQKEIEAEIAKEQDSSIPEQTQQPFPAASEYMPSKPIPPKKKLEEKINPRVFQFQQSTMGREPAPPSSKQEESIPVSWEIPPSSRATVPNVTPTLRGVPAASPEAKRRRNLLPFPEEELEKPVSLTNLFVPSGPQQPEEMEEKSPSTVRSANHQDFLARLNKIGSVSEMLKEVLVYSETLEKINSQESLQLLAVAEGFLEKTSGDFDDFLKSPGKKKVLKSKSPQNDNDEELEKSSEPLDPQLQYRQPGTFQSIPHGLPEREFIGRRWSDFPFLKNLNFGDLVIPGKDTGGGNSANQILKKLESVFLHSKLAVGHLPNFADRLLKALKEAIPRGLLVSNMKCGIGNRPNDCVMKVFSYINLSDLYPKFTQRLKFVAHLRLNIMTGEVQFINISDTQIE